MMIGFYLKKKKSKLDEKNEPVKVLKLGNNAILDVIAKYEELNKNS